MAQTAAQRRASDYVAAWLARNEKNPAWLVDATGMDPGTVGDFLNGQRWPKIGSQGKIERAVGLSPGTIRQIGNGGPMPESDPEPEPVEETADSAEGELWQMFDRGAISEREYWTLLGALQGLRGAGAPPPRPTRRTG